MSVRRLVAFVLVPLLAGPPVVSVAGAAPQARPAGLQINVNPSPACVIAREYPQFEGTVMPANDVNRARLFFHSGLAPDFYYVEAVLEGGRYVARLPRPRLDASPIVFYLEATKTDFSQGRSLEGNAMVVRKIEECPRDRQSAPVAPGGPVSVFDVAGNPAFPAGFEGVTGAGGGVAAASSAGVGAAAGAGSFLLTSTTGLIVAGAALATGTVVVLSSRGGRSAVPPGRFCDPNDLRPGCQPSPSR